MKKKRNKLRGSQTHGWGSKKKHRGAGSRGGVGGAGAKKQNKIRMWSREERLGKRGFKSLPQRKIEPAVRAINLRDINRLATGKEVDLTGLKVIGAGSLEKPLVIKARAFSALAEEKIQKAGGKAVKDVAEGCEEVS